MKVVIVGNGVAGITCAMDIRKRDADAQITVIGGETEYFFSRTALMYAFMDHMTRKDLEPYERGSYDKQDIELVHAWVTGISHARRTVTTDAGEEYEWDKLVLACGARPRMVDWPGLSDVKDGLAHFVSMQDLDTCERLTRKAETAVVVGGGLIGVELAECLRTHGKEVHFLIREPYYWPAALAREEADFVEEHMREHGVQLHLSDELAEICTDSSGSVSGIKTGEGKEIACQMLGICIGVTPNIEWLDSVGDKPATDRGILVDECFETSLDDVFAVGDCMEMKHPSRSDTLIETIWYSARRHGRYAARNVFGDAIAYDPPIFFNSSKFFEIEFTTVGQVKDAPDGSPSIYLKHPSKNQSARVVHNGDRVIGFNMLGSAWDHTVMMRWIEERRSPEWVVSHLRDAQFDVEFGRAPIEKFERSDIPLQPIDA
jgi:NAD(P)H-nitrite reductase large subunit